MIHTSHNNNTPENREANQFLSVGTSIATGLVGGGVAGSYFGFIPSIIFSLIGGIWGWYAQRKNENHSIQKTKERQEVY